MKLSLRFIALIGVIVPRRLRSVLTVFLIGLVMWGIVSLLVTGVREHAD